MRHSVSVPDKAMQASTPDHVAAHCRHYGNSCAAEEPKPQPQKLFCVTDDVKMDTLPSDVISIAFDKEIRLFSLSFIVTRDWTI